MFESDILDEQPMAVELRIVESVLLAGDVDIAAFEDYRRYFIFGPEITLAPLRPRNGPQPSFTSSPIETFAVGAATRAELERAR